MVYEIAEIKIRNGANTAFEDAARATVELFRAANGCRGMRMERSLENPGHYFLVVQWESVDHHMIEFRNSPAFSQFRELVSKYFDGAPRMQHTSTVAGY